MIRVTIELFPYGKETRKVELGKVEIANIGDGNYRAKATLDAPGELPSEYYSNSFYHDRKLNVLWLLEKAISALLDRYDFPEFKEMK